MKKFLLIFFLFHFSGFVFAQNWTVINSTDKFNFRLGGDDIITSTIWADSVQLSNGDSVFYLNRIMCDTCATLVGGPNACDTCYGLKNRPQFMQRSIFTLPNGIVNFRDTANIVINTLAALNDSWIFDSTQNISATVVATGADSVFGNSDSTKTLLLSTGDTVKLSQTFGILQYPKSYSHNSYYRLVGIEVRNLGEHVPKFADFFNFDVGDMFEYWGDDAYLEHNCPDLEEYCEWKRKLTVTLKYQNGDSLIYNFSGLEKRICNDIANGSGPYCTFNSFSSVAIYVDSASHWTNKYNHQPVKLEHLYSDINYFNTIPCGADSFAYNAIKISSDTNLLATKSLGIGAQFYNYYFSDELVAGSDTLFPVYPIAVYSIQAKAGLGVTVAAWSGCFEAMFEEHLVAYRKGNDTVGVFTPDSLLRLGINENNFSTQLKVFPNPADETIHLNLPYKTETIISVTDLQGKILLQKRNDAESFSIEVKDISNGFYFLTLTTDKEKITRKIIVQHL